MRALRLLPADLPHLRRARGGDGFAARPHQAHANGLGWPGRRGQRRIHAAHRRVPRLPRLRDRVPLGCGVRQAGRGRARPARARAQTRTPVAIGPHGRVPIPTAEPDAPRGVRALLGHRQAHRRRPGAPRDRAGPARGSARAGAFTRLVAGHRCDLRSDRRPARPRRALHGLRHARRLRRYERGDGAGARAQRDRGRRARRTDVLRCAARPRRRAE